MSPEEIEAKRQAQRQLLESRREAMRAQLEARREAAMQELERKRAAVKKPEEAQPRRRWLALIALLLLALLLQNCQCREEPPAPECEPCAEAEPGPAGEPEPPVRPLTGRVQRQDRPEYSPDAPPPLPWLDRFRLQVAARSPRLAECFVEANRPGTLKWTTTVDPAHGSVSEHALEPTLLSDELTARQRECVLGVLTEPGYTLDADADERARRVGMVIEF
ncbi:MAG: hypothetical protein H6740_28325 [Alphaproteobacteria bacterium]|nr:hypothetical protein [Alphaproteobacteria bacterium]